MYRFRLLLFTKTAGIKYQKAHNITPQSGYVGALTRAVLNLGTTGVSTGTGATLIQNLQSQLNALLAQIAALKAISTATTSVSH